MLSLRNHSVAAAGSLMLCSLLLACAQPAVRPETSAKRELRQQVDFSGSWELDYERSDDVNRRLKRLFRSMSRTSRNAGAQGNLNAIASTSSLEAVVALARLAESITRSQVLQIAHDEREITVERDQNFVLSCGFYSAVAQPFDTGFGTEICGWDGEQMVFHVSLPDGLMVSHRLTVAPDRQKLHIATTVASSAAAAPFTLSRFYDRFEPLPSEYDCEYTLSKRRSCVPRTAGP